MKDYAARYNMFETVSNGISALLTPKEEIEDKLAHPFTEWHSAIIKFNKRY